MPFHKHKEDSTQSIHLKAPTHFNGSLLREFRSCYEGDIDYMKTLIIDFSDTNSIDSTVIGALLLLNEKMSKKTISLLLISLNDELKASINRMDIEKQLSIA